MKKASQKLLLVTLVLLLSFAIVAQEDLAVPKTNKSVVWKVVEGDGEFAVAMPDGFETFVDGDYWISNRIDIKKHITVTRLLNRVFLMVEMYEGDAKNIQKEMVSRLTRGENPYQLTNDETADGIMTREFKLTLDGNARIQRFYQFKKRLYIVQTIAPVEKNVIAEMFLDSVTLGKNTVTKKPQKEIIEILPIRDDEPSSEKPDRVVVVFYKPRAHYTDEVRNKGVSGEVVVKGLFSSSGRITRGEVISGPKELRKLALDALSGIRFLPAEKDGKLISTWKQVSYSFSIY